MGSGNAAAAKLASDDPSVEGYPRRFGPYLLLSAFAHGGMGEVYLAKSGGIEGIDRLCVLKKLRPDVAKNKEYLGRFIDEARVVVQLSHANIAHVFDVGAVGDEHYMAMEYVSGANAREIQVRAADEEAHGLDVGLAVLIASEMLEALDYAHRHKHPLTGKPLTIVHRDVSPQNVMVSFEGEVKLIDFGLAASELKEEQTESQVVMGKVAYMSPEQARGEVVDPKTDQFAAAMVLYELLAGERFYGSKSNYEIWQVVGKGGFVPRRFPELPAELTRILSRALSPDATMRYPTCSEFKDELDIYVRTQHPHATKRALRELMERLFERDQRAERKFLTQYADVSAAQICAEAPGKARSFVAKDDGSDDAPAAAIAALEGASSDDASAALPPRARTETAAPLPDEVKDQGPAQRERTVVIERDFTGAAVREAFPESKRPAAAALLVVLLLIGFIAWLLMQGVGERQDPVVAKAVPTEAVPEERAAPPVDDAEPSEPSEPSDPAESSEPAQAEGAATEAAVEPPVAEAAASATPPAASARPRARARKDSRKQRRVAAATPKNDAEPTESAPAVVKIATQGDATVGHEQTATMRVKASGMLKLSQQLEGLRWPDSSSERVRSVLNKCVQKGLIAGAVSRMTVSDEKLKATSVATVNRQLEVCREKATAWLDSH